MSPIRDKSDQISTGVAIGLFARALRYIRPFRFDFGVKWVLVLISFIPLLILPWPARILVDHIIQGVPFGDQPRPFPFFIQPFVDFIAGLSIESALIYTIGAQLVLLILTGAFGIDSGETDRATDFGVPEGWDTATRTENQANAGFSLVGGLLGLVDFRWTIRLSQKLNHHYRSRLFKRVQTLPMSELSEQRIGDAIYRVMYDTTAITNTAYQLILTPILSPLFILLQSWVMGMVYGWNSPIFYAGLLFVLVTFLPSLPFAGLQRRFSGRSRQTGATTTSSLEESMSNMVAVQSLGGEDRERSRFDSDSEDSFRQYRIRTLVEFSTAGVVSIIGAGLVAYIFIYVGDSIIAGELSAGDFLVLLTFFISIASASIDLGSLWFRLQADAPGFSRVFDLMDAESEAEQEEQPDLPRLHGSIAFQDVHFAYPDAGETLSGINQELHLGQLTAIVGPAGAGKTTLAYLIPRFLTPERGQVLFDGHNTSEYNLTSLRRQIAFVFQETMLFDASIAENLRLGRPEASLEDLREASRTAGALDFIEALPEGFETSLGRAGGKLSVGQKQRLSIARALVCQTPILILDEPTSALDPDTERNLVAALREASQERLVLVIAHRLSTIREADQILFLDAGQILERGSHRELMSIESGRYREYVEMQTRGLR
ncbi:MAG: ABC transporter ATP-binding protein [Myxococcota bacterium]|nr:ABC transporter ATP-binding protein [Myxococcota bacterium]